MASQTNQTEVVKAREFDLTKFAKLLGGGIAVLAPAVAGGLEAFKKVEVPTPVTVAALGVTAVALLGIAFVSAVDIAARAFLSGEGSAQKAGSSEEEKSDPPAVIPAPSGMQLWLKDGGGPHPVLAMSSVDGKVSSYLVATGSVHDRTVEGAQVKAVDGTAKWHGEDEVQALRSEMWP